MFDMDQIIMCWSVVELK